MQVQNTQKKPRESFRTLCELGISLLTHVHGRFIGKAVPHLVSDLVRGLLVLPFPQIDGCKQRQKIPCNLIISPLAGKTLL